MNYKFEALKEADAEMQKAIKKIETDAIAQDTFDIITQLANIQSDLTEIKEHLGIK